MNPQGLPTTGFLRLKQIIGDRKKGTPSLIPVGSTTWWAGVKDGRYPPGYKISARTTAWRVEDIRALIESATSPLGSSK